MKKIKVLLIGSGGREHALAWKIAQSPRCGSLYIAPGNPGTALCGENVPITATDFDALAAFCGKHGVDLVVVGPEIPLVLGIVDDFAQREETAAIPVIGPSRNAAQLEGSKSFAKRFMARQGIPTAAYREVDATQRQDALHWLASQPMPVVLKADGLAAGKGVVICENIPDAQQTLNKMLEGQFGEAGSRVVIETFLKGWEMSVFVLSDGSNYVLLPTAKDYKRIGEGDTGLNTGGMGAISPVPMAGTALMERIESRVVRPTIDGLCKEKLDYRGLIYFGLMIVGEEPYVIEYNCRLGDPETQAVVLMIKGDLLEAFERTHKGGLKDFRLEQNTGAAATVILASGGYPGDFEKNLPIEGLESPSKAMVFHAGTTRDSRGVLRTAGGRVLAISAVSDQLSRSLSDIYKCISTLHFDSCYYRRDIGKDMQ